AWLISLPLVLLAWVLHRREEGEASPSTGPGWRTLSVVLLCLGYIAAYLLSPHRVEPETIQTALQGTGWEWGSELSFTGGGTSAPALNPVRYLPPIYLAWTLALGLGIALAWRVRRLHRHAVALLVLTGGLGTAMAAVEAVKEGDSQRFGELKSYLYDTISLPGRIPPMAVHERSLNDQPDSRAFHLWSMGWLTARPMEEVLANPGAQREAMAALRSRHALSSADYEEFLRGLGAGLADYNPGGGSEDLLVLLRALEAVAAGLDSRERRALYSGSSAAMDHEVLRSEPGVFVPALCNDTFAQQPRLCRELAGLLVDANLDFFPTKARGLFPPEVPWDRLSSDWQSILIRGAADNLAQSNPGFSPPEAQLANWEPIEARFFRAAWSVAQQGGR
ncbi:MAG: hypothetical protein VX498_04270, partial [Myxococcota bacterium]|nr:hypothetical protein [Myxococcota bacterium]